MTSEKEKESTIKYMQSKIQKAEKELKLTVGEMAMYADNIQIIAKSRAGNFRRFKKWFQTEDENIRIIVGVLTMQRYIYVLELELLELDYDNLNSQKKNMREYIDKSKKNTIYYRECYEGSRKVMMEKLKHCEQVYEDAVKDPNTITWDSLQPLMSDLSNRHLQLKIWEKRIQDSVKDSHYWNDMLISDEANLKEIVSQSPAYRDKEEDMHEQLKKAQGVLNVLRDIQKQKDHVEGIQEEDENDSSEYSSDQDYEEEEDYESAY